jgi:ubiquinone/menaquinone biosynthesis C-methylase UbiE
MIRAWYESHLLPRLIDIACGMPAVRRQRLRVIPKARGRVLEIGIGTGLNMAYYEPQRVRSIVGVEPSLRMHRLALRRGKAAGLEVRLVGLSAEKLPLADASFDTIVSTFTLCSIPDPLAALKEMRRVLAPGGRLLFAEHGRAPDPSVLKWQRRLQPMWVPLAGGCHLDRDIPALLREAGFVPQVQQRYLPGPKFLSYHYWGEAVVGRSGA